MWRRPKEWEGKRKELLLNDWKGGFEWVEFSFVNGWGFSLLMGGWVVLNSWRYALESGVIWCCEAIGMGWF